MDVPKRFAARALMCSTTFKFKSCSALICSAGWGKEFGVELQRAVAQIPAQRAIAGAQINHRVARQFFVAEFLRDLQGVIRAKQRAVGLHVAHDPFGAA